MATNLTIESPNFEKIGSEAGQFTSDAISLLWAALNDTRAEQRRQNRLAVEQVAPKVLQVNAGASVDNLDLEGASIVEFVGTSAQNFTGIRAPETGKSRIVFVVVSGSGTITVRHLVTSETANQFDNAGAADLVLATRGNGVWVYLSGKWREVA